MKKEAKNLPDEVERSEYISPLGTLVLTASKTELYELTWKIEKKLQPRTSSSSPVIAKTKKQLDEYFQNKRTVFDIPLHIQGTQFQKNAWNALCKIPYGQTICYQEQAIMLGDKKKAQAVGQANTRNPLPIIIPCHRVISKTGKTHGYSYGENIKEGLLAIENSSK